MKKIVPLMILMSVFAFAGCKRYQVVSGPTVPLNAYGTIEVMPMDAKGPLAKARANKGDEEYQNYVKTFQDGGTILNQNIQGMIDAHWNGADKSKKLRVYTKLVDYYSGMGGAGRFFMGSMGNGSMEFETKVVAGKKVVATYVTKIAIQGAIASGSLAFRDAGKVIGSFFKDNS